MLRKIVLHFWSLRREFAKYFVIGIVGVGLDMGSLFILKQYFRLTAVMAVIINQVFLINYAFFLNKYWAFKSKGITHHQMVRFYFLSGLNYLVAIGWMYLFHQLLDFDYLLVRLFNIALAVSWNFLLYKHWVYKH